ncbi:hypothetical protein MPDQ_003686 [Monascus purpureus]|uniref:F-box domain-containing protein n=1 Tax=Monascus purpureus TaxID=5098 RepID=A0A507R169_MONPU|nr:hypothetical protein MPDQ_003686 [Monascus purpureus]BDD63023.1 hypothetical protein MAP00_007972 [Monascus purpureus]
MADNAELESFRRQWREEVARRTRQRPGAKPEKKPSVPPEAQERFPPTRHEASERKEEEEEEEGDGAGRHNQAELVQNVEQLTLGVTDEDAFHRKEPLEEPSSALEHFERAVQKEAEGSLGDSLQHYRKAYRLDSAVDKTYRDKHFAHAWKKSQAPSVPTVSQAAQQSQDEAVPLPTSELLATFAHLPIPQAEPIIKGDLPPPCPIANVPSDILVEILRHVALIDPASLCRMALVCKRLAYHFAYEQHVWKQLCQDSKFGFGAMHYSFVCDIYGHPIYTLGPQYTLFPPGVPVHIPRPLSSWSQVFQSFPRVRFTGVYISTVNYTRAGAASSYHNVSWNSPIHIVTYYRYLRFYPDGTVVSLLSTTEPVDVVPHISKENVLTAKSMTHRQHHHFTRDLGTSLSGAVEPVPPVAMAALKYAHLGRWHLARPTSVTDKTCPDSKAQENPQSPPSEIPEPSGLSDPRDLVIETEGADPKYIYTMHLSLRSTSASKSASANAPPSNTSKNTKLAWKGYWSYNKLTDDWAEFGLRNDRAYVFRRVRGWGMN